MPTLRSSVTIFSSAGLRAAASPRRRPFGSAWTRLPDWQRILDANVSDQLSRIQLTRINVDGEELIPLDIDVAVFEDTFSHKEGVLLTYHKVNGFAPIFCYAGREGFMVANELRPGSQHSGNGALKFLKRCIAIMLQAGYEAKELLVRPVALSSPHGAA